MQQISEGKGVQTEGGVEVGPGKQRGEKKMRSLQLGERKLMHIWSVQIITTLPKKSGIKGLCKILLTDLFLRVIKIMPEKQFLFLSLDLIQKLYIALEIFLFLTSFFK